MIGSVASQFSCCFSSREQKHKCKSKKIAHSRLDGYLHNATWVLEVSKDFRAQKHIQVNNPFLSMLLYNVLGKR